MKTRFLKSILLLMMSVFTLPMIAQDYSYVNVILKNGDSKKFFLKDVSKIYTSKTDANGMQQGDSQFQYITTVNEEFVCDLDEIDCIDFVKSNVPTEAIDLGLPSGIKWASCNVGASKPEEYGGHYSWGETEEKEIYEWFTYTHCDGTVQTCHDLSPSICGTENDVAHVKWGGNWRMPTVDEIQELFDNCTTEWTTYNDVNGMKFVSNINGNSIFLPATGYCWFWGIYGEGNWGYYWSGIQNQETISNAYNLYFDMNGVEWNKCSNRNDGRAVRPVTN